MDMSKSILHDPTRYADAVLGNGYDPAEAEDMIREAQRTHDPRFRNVPASWFDAVVIALHTPR